MLDPQAPACPLCASPDLAPDIRGADKRRYLLCRACSLIFAHPSHHLDLAAERAHYSNHQNGIQYPGYTQFLSRALLPMLPYLDPSMRGLDYGCGPTPTLSLLLQRHNIPCDDFDPLFSPSPPCPPYDFIFSTECFEHFYCPRSDIERVCSLLKPNGLLCIMTERWTSLSQFASWYYTIDPTHTSFFHLNTLHTLQPLFSLSLLWSDPNRVAIFRKRTSPCPPHQTNYSITQKHKK
jgi:hypothetical protein